MLEEAFHNIITALRRPWVSGLVTIGTFAVAVSAFTTFLTDTLGTWQTAALALIATVVIVLLVPPLESLVQFLLSLRQRGITVEEVAGPVPRHRGLIVLSSIGQGIGSAESAIYYHWREMNKEYPDPVLECCWVITSGPASEQSATGLVNKLVQNNLPVKMFHLKPLSAEDADNPKAVHRLVDEIYAEAKEKYSLDEEEVIADYTGGTKSMTSGMVLACTSPRRPLQFMKPRQYDDHGRADPRAGADPVAIDIRFELKPQAKRR